MQPSLFDAAEGRRRRDEGIKTVTERSPNWQDSLVAFIDWLPAGWVGLAEDIRDAWYKAGGAEPHHPNAWGAAVRTAVAKKILRPTGAFRHAKSVKTHAHRYAEYERS